MAAILLEPVIAAITVGVTAIIEAVTESAIVAAIAATVTAAVEVAIVGAIATIIASTLISGVMSGVISGLLAQKAIRDALEKSLHKDVKCVIGDEGLNDMSEAMAAIPLGMVFEKMIGEIGHDLWVFADPTFYRLTRLIGALRSIEEGEDPEVTGDVDQDEEKCRFFKGPEVEDNSEDFIFFTVFKSAECKEGDEVYSMSAQWKKLKSLVDDPIGGHYVSQIFQELFENCVEDVDEEEVNSSFVAGNANQAVKKEVGKVQKVVKVVYGKLVLFGNKTIHTMQGPTRDKRKSNWLKAYFVLGYEKCSKCYIESENPACGHNDPLENNIVGGHVWSPALKMEDKGLFYYIVPICKRHNDDRIYHNPRQNGTRGWLKTSSDAFAMKITSTNEVAGWKEMSSHLKGFKLITLSAEAVNRRETSKCHEIIQPNQLKNTLPEAIHNIVREFSESACTNVMKEVTEAASEELRKSIVSAGEETKQWTHSQGKNIMLISLIPVYGMYQAVKRLYSLKSDAINRFHSGTRSSLSDYKKDCLGDEEQKRRKQRIIDETNRVISSHEWKDRIGLLRETIMSTVPTFKNNIS